MKLITTVYNYIRFLYIKHIEPSKINNRCRIHIAIYQYWKELVVSSNSLFIIGGSYEQS
nr:MAG TPA: hypothetical protein [Caudoviricetes sp.]